MAKWTERITTMKAEQYSKKETLEYALALFKRKGINFVAKHKLKFEQAWREPAKVNPTVEDIVPEVDLPSDLSKIKPFQETQIINVFKHLDKMEISRRWKLLDIALNLAHSKNKTKLVESLSRLSDIIYKSKMVKRDLHFEQSSFGQKFTELTKPQWEVLMRHPDIRGATLNETTGHIKCSVFKTPYNRFHVFYSQKEKRYLKPKDVMKYYDENS
jgi:hypothetical protein